MEEKYEMLDKELNEKIKNTSYLESNKLDNDNNNKIFKMEISRLRSEH